MKRVCILVYRPVIAPEFCMEDTVLYNSTARKLIQFLIESGELMYAYQTCSNGYCDV